MCTQLVNVHTAITECECAHSDHSL